MYWTPTQSSEVAMEDFSALRESPGAPFEPSEVASKYTIAIQESPRAASRLPKEQGSTLQVHSLVPEDSRKVCKVRHSESTSAASGGFCGFRYRTIDFADEAKE
ncbi:hypothetical protein K440DRAFT_641845 [Wilcoxina mikolae CBS 423.85]|nr:hypothetical protein K440DRAFT_641845 [Wilcoxina mikolae CBS 423.85]